MTSETEQAVERLTEAADRMRDAGGVTVHVQSPGALAADLRLILTALAHSEAEGRRLRESLTETVDALGQATGLLKACEDDIDINVVIAIRDGAGRIVRTLATLHSPTIIETGSAVLKRARAALTNKTEE